MSLLSKLLALLGLGTRTPSHASTRPGALAAPPELVSRSEEGRCDLVLLVDRCELLPLGSQVLRATAVHGGRRVGLEVVFGPDWREEPLGEQGCYQGMVTWRSVGGESDGLLRVLDELYGTECAPAAMAKLTDFACVSLSGDPRELRNGPVRAKLFFEAEDQEGNAELYVNVDLAANRLEIREKDPDDRAAIVRALTAAASS